MDCENPPHWVFILGWLTMGGAERQALILAKELKSRGARVTIIGLSTPGSFLHECQRLGIDARFWPYKNQRRPDRWLKAVGAYARRLRQLRPTYIAPYCMPANLLAGIVWRFTGARSCVWQQRDEGRHRKPGVSEWLAKKLTPAFISNSAHGALWLEKAMGIKKSMISVVRNGVEFPPQAVERGNWRVRHGIPREALVVSMVGNIHRFKDHETLIRAWGLVTKNFNEPRRLRLVLAGEKHGGSWREVKKIIDEQDLGAYVYCPGQICDVSSLLMDSDLVAFSSRYEGVPNAILEAMAFGRLVVATDVPGNREALGDVSEDFFAAPGDADDLAAKIISILNGSEQFAETGEANKQRIETLFSVEQMVDSTVKVHEAVSNARHGVFEE